ncbi:MAG: sugar kinase [Azospirillaceae bacterium]
MTDTPPRIVCLGEPLVEFNELRAEDLPDGAGAGLFRRGFGGDTSNCAIAAARFGARVGYVTAVGTDSFGDDLMALWRREGVDVTGVRRDADAPTGIYFVSLGPDGHRFTYRRAGSAASRLRPAHVPHALIGGASILHVSAISQAIGEGPCDAVFHAIDIAHGAGVTVAYDTNLRLGLWPLDRARAIIRATAARADILLPGLDDARQLTGLEEVDAILDAFLALGPRLVALSLGGDGLALATRGERWRLPGHAVDFVDATGAGDAFDGAFLAELDAGATPLDAARLANAAAALSTTGRGAVDPLVGREAAAALLSSDA